MRDDVVKMLRIIFVEMLWCAMVGQNRCTR